MLLSKTCTLRFFPYVRYISSRIAGYFRQTYATCHANAQLAVRIADAQTLALERTLKVRSFIKVAILAAAESRLSFRSLGCNAVPQDAF